MEVFILFHFRIKREDCLATGRLSRTTTLRCQTERKNGCYRIKRSYKVSMTSLLRNVSFHFIFLISKLSKLNYQLFFVVE